MKIQTFDEFLFRFATFPIAYLSTHPGQEVDDLNFQQQTRAFVSFFIIQLRKTLMDLGIPQAILETMYLEEEVQKESFKQIYNSLFRCFRKTQPSMHLRICSDAQSCAIDIFPGLARQIKGVRAEILAN